MLIMFQDLDPQKGALATEKNLREATLLKVM